jgi:signal transduction histidine kinase
MIEPKIPANEQERLKELESFSILDTLEEEDFDNLTALASSICKTPISLVSLLDDKRQWFKSHHGLDVTETPKVHSFCGHAINQPDEVFVVNDSRNDKRFYDNPLVEGKPNVIFYAGVPLLTKTGLPLGTLCVIDHKPRELSSSQTKSLQALARQVVNLLYLRKKEAELNNAVARLKIKNDELDKFAFVAAHDLSSPLRNISGLTGLLRDMYDDKLDEKGKDFMRMIEQSSTKLQGLVEGLLEYSRNENYINENKEDINLRDLADYINSLFTATSTCHIKWSTDLKEVNTNPSGLHQILINLISNAVKHNDKSKIEIEISVKETTEAYKWQVKDNGPGIPEKFHERVFDIFTALPSKNNNEGSNGIGLATVKKLVHSFGGEVTLNSTLNEGSTFCFTIAK